MHDFKYGVDSSVLLLVIDVQQAFVSAETKHILPRIQALLPDYAHVAATQFFNPAVSNYRKLLHWQDCGKHEPGFSLALDLPDRGLIFQKSSYSCLTPGLKKTFLDLKIQDVHLCGLDTDACVLSTAMEIFDANLRPVVISSACASSGGIALHNNAITMLKRNIGAEQVL
jgi:Amidases related to nicotinamidase